MHVPRYVLGQNCIEQTPPLKLDFNGGLWYLDNAKSSWSIQTTMILQVFLGIIYFKSEISENNLIYFNIKQVVYRMK